jgi:hypothetical protein
MVRSPLTGSMRHTENVSAACRIKRPMLFLQILAMAVMFSGTFAAAKSENAALLVNLVAGCEWFLDGLVAEGSIHYVETQNGKWKPSCQGNIVEGLPIEKAVIAHSTADHPLGECVTPFGSTFDWHATFSPKSVHRRLVQWTPPKGRSD